MNDAEYDKARARLLGLLDKWLTPLGLRWWRITLEYAREGIPRAPGDDRTETVLFDVKADWKYLHALIRASMPDVAEMDTEDAERLEWAFVHELAHILINECRQMDAKDWLAHEERVASTLASAFLWTWKDARERYEVPVEPGTAYGMLVS